MSYQKKRVNSPCLAYKVSDCAIFFKIACYRSEWLGCRFLFLPAHSIYGFSKKLEIQDLKKIKNFLIYKPCLKMS